MEGDVDWVLGFQLKRILGVWETLDKSSPTARTELTPCFQRSPSTQTPGFEFVYAFPMLWPERKNSGGFREFSETSSPTRSPLRQDAAPCYKGETSCCPNLALPRVCIAKYTPIILSRAACI